MRNVIWNDKGLSLLSQIHREAYERGEELRRFDGELLEDCDRLYLQRGEHIKLVGTVGTPSASQPKETKPKRAAKKVSYKGATKINVRRKSPEA